MNNTFSIQRFGLLLKRQWLEFGKIYLVSLAVIFGIFLVFYGYYYKEVLEQLDRTLSQSGRRLNFREPLFIVAGFLFITIIASNYFAHLGQKSKAIIDLLIPASTFEKFLTGLFFVIFLGIGSYLLLFYVTDLIFVARIRNLYEGVSAVSTAVGEVREVKITEELPYFFEKNNPNEFKALYFLPFLVTSIFFLGSIYFNKFHYIKTAISVMIFSGVTTYILFKTGEWLMKGKVMINDGDMGNEHLSKSTAELYVSILFIVLTLIFWSITYVRLKEKEV